MTNLTRRNFLSTFGAAMGVGTATMLGGYGALTAEEAFAAPAASEGFVPGGGSFAEGALDLGWTGTPAAIEAVGGSTMPLAELNRRRKAYIESKTEDHVCEDGTVVPVVFVQAAAKVNSIGAGTLESTDNGVFPDAALISIMADLDEEQAQFYIDMPTDVNFNIVDASISSGRPIEECDALLQHLHSRGYIAKHERNDGTVYHCFPLFQGLAEMSMLNHAYRQEPIECNPGTQFAGMPGYSSNVTWLEEGTPVFHAVPVNASVVAEDSTMLDYDDVRAILPTKRILSLGPCVCRYGKALRGGSTTLPTWEQFNEEPEEWFDYYDETIGQYIMNCIYMDDEAENGISMGYCHEASVEEVLESLERSAEEGYIIHVAGGKRSETICCCNVDGGCGMCNLYAALGDAVTNYPAFDQKHRYTLEVDLDSCIGCGACVNRCPMHAVTLGDDGKPQVNATCLTCGQCAVTCPQEARKLVSRSLEEIAELPENFVEDNMIKAAYRFEHGLIA